MKKPLEKFKIYLDDIKYFDLFSSKLKNGEEQIIMPTSVYIKWHDDFRREFFREYRYFLSHFIKTDGEGYYIDNKEVADFVQNYMIYLFEDKYEKILFK